MTCVFIGDMLNQAFPTVWPITKVDMRVIFFRTSPFTTFREEAPNFSYCFGAALFEPRAIPDSNCSLSQPEDGRNVLGDRDSGLIIVLVDAEDVHPEPLVSN